jgi:hypothetical protein
MSLLIPDNKPLPSRIEVAENTLAEAFARDRIIMDELEKRLHHVQEARSDDEINNCLGDLPADLLTESQTEVYTTLSEASMTKQKSKHTTVLSSKHLRGGKLKKKRPSGIELPPRRQFQPRLWFFIYGNMSLTDPACPRNRYW